MKPNPLAACALAALLAPAAAGAQLPDDEELHGPALAWERGDYPAAVRGYLAALEGHPSERRVRDVAALTGEIYRTDRLAVDGRDPVVGPESRYVAFEVPLSDAGSVTRVVRLDDGREVATLEGTGATLGAGGRVAYFAVDATPELRAARREEAAAEGRGARYAARARVAWLEARSRALRVRDLEDGTEATVDLSGWMTGDAVWGPGGEALYVVAARPGEAGRNDVLRIVDGEVEVLDTGPGFKDDLVPVAGGSLLVWTAPASRPVPVEPGTGPARVRVGVGALDLASGRRAFVAGATEPAVAADGSRIAWLGERDGRATVESVPLTFDALTDHLGPPLAITDMPLADLAVSPDGAWVAYRKQPVDDWEIYAVPTSGPRAGEELQVTWEIQHDLYPVFVDARTVMAMKGEGRHRRAFLYDLERIAAGEPSEPVRLHHNNTLRTIAPEYAWAPAPDGSAVVVVAERDGDTVSPERGVWAVHLDRPVGAADLRKRLEESLEAEVDLRERGRAMFAPLAERVRTMTEGVDAGRVYHHAGVLYAFGSKHITRPGNRRAADHIVRTLRSWGYEPELQWFEPRPGIRTANVVARLPGTTDPGVVYVVSSHYDSVERGPGADDNTSGTTALLEVARVMKDHPQRATIEFAFFTGEEAGLLGSREYVRRAVAEGKDIVGALNNDMVGWANGPRLDNTIRYSNPGIRDVQHAAAMLFSDLITYDALYYKSTDAHAYYEQYGDIVGGIGSYPVLGNPHYHEFTDRLNTVNHGLVAEVARTTVATLALLASSPSRVRGLALEGAGDGIRASWSACPETGITAYRVEWTDAAGALRTATVDGTTHALPSVLAGSTVRVRAVGAGGLEGWDWARAEVPR